MKQFPQTKIGRPPEEDLAQMGGAINEWEPTTDSFPGLIVGYLSKLPQSLLISIGFLMLLLVGILTHMAGPELSSRILLDPYRSGYLVYREIDRTHLLNPQCSCVVHL